MSKRIALSNNRLTVSSVDSNGFKSALGTTVFKAGRKYYFEVTITKGKLIKLGVARPDANLEEAFCDGSKGWALYNGELRHSSNSTGTKYGTPFKENDIIGVYLDMIEGTLSFSKNGKLLGEAFKNDDLKKGDLVAAVAPFSTGDIVTLNMAVLED